MIGKLNGSVLVLRDWSSWFIKLVIAFLLAYLVITVPGEITTVKVKLASIEESVKGLADRFNDHINAKP